MKSCKELINIIAEIKPNQHCNDQLTLLLDHQRYHHGHE